MYDDYQMYDPSPATTGETMLTIYSMMPILLYGFYVAFMLFLFALIFRAVAIEFRSKQPQAWWRRTWDTSFSISSIVSSLLLGVALGNMVWGIELDADHEFVGGFWSLLHPYPLLVGVTSSRNLNWLLTSAN